MANSGAMARLISVNSCHGAYSAYGTPSAATMNTDVACHGITLSIMVPQSSIERESTLRGMRSRSKRSRKASPTMKLVAYWFEVKALVTPPATSADRIASRRVEANEKMRLTTVGMAWITSSAPMKKNTRKAMNTASFMA